MKSRDGKRVLARPALARKMHGIWDAGASSIKRLYEGASQLEDDDAWVVSVVLEHFGQPISGQNWHDGSMFWRCDVGAPQRGGA